MMSSIKGIMLGVVLNTLVCSCCSLCLTECMSTYDRVYLEMELAQLFQERADVDVEPECRMFAGGSAGFCYFQATPDEIADLVSGLDLQDADPEEDFLDLLLLEEGEGCRAEAPFDDPAFTSIYTTRYPSQEIRLSNGANGVAFAHLLLYYRTDTGEVCVQAVYAYG